jgi:DNA polymerase I
MVEYLRADLEVSYSLYRYYYNYISSPKWKDSLRVEHEVAQLCLEMHLSGFHFNHDGCVSLLEEAQAQLQSLTTELLDAFPPRSVPIREVLPKATKFGTINRTDFRWLDGGDLSPYSVGHPFSLIDFRPFNPGSPKQVVERLNEAGWKPFEKTKGHIACERAAKGTYDRKTRLTLAPIDGLEERLAEYRETGWKVNEANLATLPAHAPEASRKLVQWLVLNSRVGDLKEWLASYDQTSGRIHGSFNHIGAWTHRMSHNNPNMANIPRVMETTKEPTPVQALNILYNGRMRALWSCPSDMFLIGVDAESIQLRILAHYMNDAEFTFAVTQGSKKDESDPHSVNKRALGSACSSRDDAKTFIYAWLLGAGKAKVADILKCSVSEASEANERFLTRYEGLAKLKREDIPADAKRGYFVGFDGRLVKQDEEHLMLAGYLQNGEAVIMKRACVLWRSKLREENIPFEQPNFVHDEWQTYVPRDMALAQRVAEIQAQSIKQIGEDLQLRCPMAGSFLNSHGSFTIGDNWLDTH